MEDVTESCKKSRMHKSFYMTYDEFSELSDLSERFKIEIFEHFETNLSEEQMQSLIPHQKLKPPEVTSALIDEDFKVLHSCLRHMSDLTGLLLVIPKDTNKVEYYGTGFIINLKKRRSSPFSNIQGENQKFTEHAIVTVSTAYHIFHDGNVVEKRRFKEINNLWDSYKIEFKLGYNTGHKSLQELQESTEFPTLEGQRLIEMDKDSDYDCDWCAIEFVTDDRNLIDSLEHNLSEYRSALISLYQKSLTSYTNVDMFIIIGHPHHTSKRMSIGQRDKDEMVGREELKMIRSNQIWCRYFYDNLTCKGSSGSPIFKWGQPISGLGYWFGHPHNHSEGFEIEKGGISTIGVENIV